MDSSSFGVPELAVIFAMFFVFAGIGLLMLWPVGRILRRMGFSPWLSLLYIIPLVNLVVPWVIAYSDWPKVQPLSKE
jgi:hypothetical protein